MIKLDENIIFFNAIMIDNILIKYMRARNWKWYYG